ncbi:hypothetical protein N2152v2_001634 [Parachlorella kessleri]
MDLSTPLHLAAWCNNAEAIPALLRAGAWLEAQDAKKQTPLHCAARWGHLAAVLALVEAGAQVDARDNLGQTSLCWAASYGHVRVVETLVQRGAQLEIADCNGWTPLVGAVLQGKEGAVRALLELGATQSVDVKGTWAGKSLIKIAEGSRWGPRVAPLLRAEQEKTKSKAALEEPMVQQLLKAKDEKIARLKDQIECLELQASALAQVATELEDKFSLLRADAIVCRAHSAYSLQHYLEEQEKGLAELRLRVIERHREEAAQDAREERAEATLCVVCMEKPRNLFLNCGHLVCQDCGRQLSICPTCRQRVTRRTRAYL